MPYLWFLWMVHLNASIFVGQRRITIIKGVPVVVRLVRRAPRSFKDCWLCKGELNNSLFVLRERQLLGTPAREGRQETI